jgi:hypothetical protein
MKGRVALAVVPLALFAALAVVGLLSKVGTSSEAAGFTPGWVTELPLYRLALWLETWVDRSGHRADSTSHLRSAIATRPENSGIFLVETKGTGLHGLMDRPPEAAWQPRS